MNREEMDISDVGIELGFKSNIDFLNASFVNINDFDLWKRAGGNPRDWNENRRIAWQQAVENRIMFLFETFYDSFGFSKWHETLGLLPAKD